MGPFLLSVAQYIIGMMGPFLLNVAQYIIEMLGPILLSTAQYIIGMMGSYPYISYLWAHMLEVHYNIYIY